MSGEMTISISADNFKRFKELAGLNEKQSRLFFGLYSMNLGRGGPKKVAEHFGVGINTVRMACPNSRAKSLSLSRIVSAAPEQVAKQPRMLSRV